MQIEQRMKKDDGVQVTCGAGLTNPAQLGEKGRRWCR